jgi:uncharacterized surface protein with fasciclin (FAS1) repeats
MRKSIFAFLLAFAVCFVVADASHAQNGMGMAKEKSAKKGKTVAEVAMGNDNFTTLVTAVKAAGLAETLMSAGPFTVFAPTNAAFNKLPAGTVETLVKPENKEMLTKVLTYHVVAGKFGAKDVLKLIKDGNGTATLTTVEGSTLTAKTDGKTVMLTDEKGVSVNVVMADVKASNGVIHAIDGVVMPQ